MQTISDIQTLNQIKSETAVLILFGGEHCGICNSIKPKLENIIMDRLPKMQSVYIDCERSPEISAQFSVIFGPVAETACLWRNSRERISQVSAGGDLLREKQSGADRIWKQTAG